MEEFPSLEKKTLKNQKIEKRLKKKKDDDPKMSRRSFLKWGAATGAALATGGIANELMKSAGKDKREKEKQKQPKDSTESEATQQEEEIERKEEKKLNSVEKIEAGLEDVNPEETVEVKVKEKGVKGLVEKEMTLEDWAKISWKIKRLQEVKRIYGGRMKKIAEETGLTPELIAGVITQESNGDPKALSKKRVFSKKQNKYIKVPFARGLMQITPDKKEKYGISDIYHPYENMFAGSSYLKELIDKYPDLDYAISAYNLGPTGLKRRLEKGFDPSEHHYVKKVKYLSSLAQDSLL